MSVLYGAGSIPAYPHQLVFRENRRKEYHVKMNYDEIANYFAMCFMMPKDDYHKIYKENLKDGNCVNTARIAKYFNVTVSQAAQRGIDLGLIKSW